MLVLSRKIGEVIIIGDNVTLTVLSRAQNTTVIRIESSTVLEIEYDAIINLGFDWLQRLKLEEEFIIDKEIIVKIIGFKHNSVQLGFDAPRHIDINRKEVYERKANG